jgi:hypothetical protein
VLLVVVALFFLAVRVPAAPRSILILPPLLLVCAYGLRRNHRQEQRPDLVEAFVGHTRLRSCLPLLFMPVTAIAVYAPVPIWGLTVPTNWVLCVASARLRDAVWRAAVGSAADLNHRADHDQLDLLAHRPPSTPTPTLDLAPPTVRARPSA